MDIPDDLLEKIKIGESILFLGAMASAPPPEPTFGYGKDNAPPSGKDLSLTLAKSGLGYPDEDKANLQRVALWCEFREGGSRKALVDAITKEITAPHIQVSPTLHMLAALPFTIVITTNYDHLFEAALRQAKTDDGRLKDPLVQIYDPDLSGPPPQVPLSPKADRPILLKLHGDVDKPNSIVVTEEDYLVFVQKMSNQYTHPIHDNIRVHINAWPVLFIGYSLRDYNLRLLFRTLRWHVDTADFPMSFSVDRAPDNLIVSVLQKGAKPMVTFLQGDLWNFVPALYKACKGKEYQP